MGYLATTLSIAKEAMCLTEASTNTVRATPKAKTVCKTLHDRCGEYQRQFVAVTVRGTDYWANWRTGTLFDRRTGRCLSSDAMFIEV